MIPDDALWSISGVGANQVTTMLLGLAAGGNVRVGLEDNLYIRPHQLAESNAQQVQAAVTMANAMGREIATPDEARAILHLKGRDQVNY